MLAQRCSIFVYHPLINSSSLIFFSPFKQQRNKGREGVQQQTTEPSQNEKSIEQRGKPLAKERGHKEEEQEEEAATGGDQQPPAGLVSAHDDVADTNALAGELSSNNEALLLLVELKRKNVEILKMDLGLAKQNMALLKQVHELERKLLAQSGSVDELSHAREQLVEMNLALQRKINELEAKDAQRKGTKLAKKMGQLEKRLLQLEEAADKPAQPQQQQGMFVKS